MFTTISMMILEAQRREAQLRDDKRGRITSSRMSHHRSVIKTRVSETFGNPAPGAAAPADLPSANKPHLSRRF